MIKGVTKSGFEYKIAKERLENYELLEAFAEMGENPLLLPKAVELLLEEAQVKKLKDHIRDKDGLVPMKALEAEIMQIFTSQEQIKN